jgi:hypothetical protein
MLNSRGIFHPLFATHPRTTVNSAQLARVEVYEPTGNTADWTPGVGIADNLETLVWKGQARVQPNKDWRARPREFGGEFDATHAIRVQLGIGKNEVGATLDVDNKIVTYGPDVMFHKDFIVVPIFLPVNGTEVMEGQKLYVRNAEISSNAWVYNLLCDTGTK